jgi:hypothetical protein
MEATAGSAYTRAAAAALCPILNGVRYRVDRRIR